MQGIPSLKSEQSFVLRNAKLDVHGLDVYDNVNKMAFGGNNLAIPAKNGAYMVLNQVDLNGIKELQIAATAPKPQLNAAGGKVELRVGGVNGQWIGESKFLEASDKLDFNPTIITAPINLPTNLASKPQDLYIVFANPKSETQSLMVVMGMEFKLANEGEAVVVPEKNASENKDFFVGNWLAKMIGTPGGDVEISIKLERKDGKLTGTMQSKMQNDQVSPLEKVEEIEPGKIKVFFQANGMSINMDLVKEDEDNLKGRLMSMFDVTAKRVK